MAQNAIMRKPLSLTLDHVLYRQLLAHLFPGDGDEHGAVIAAGIAESERGARLLARDLFLAKDRIEYIPGKRGYRALSAEFVARISDYCASENLCYLAIHNHGGMDSVGFSSDDLASHERGYPALVDITHGGPIGGLVFAKNAVAGDIWTATERVPLSYTTIVGPKIYKLFPGPFTRPLASSRIYDRHALLFGDVGQEILSHLKVGIIGLGGGGSLINEWLARLGVGHIIAVDFDRIDVTNLPRIVGATHQDALAMFALSKSALLLKVAKKFARYKVKIAERVARQANPYITYDAIIGSIVDGKVAHRLCDVDFLFLAADTMQSRLVFNAIIHQYLIPGAQIGAKVTVDSRTRQVDDILAPARLVLPSSNGGCLSCNLLIPPDRLTKEAQSEGELQAQRYVDDETVRQPSVITLNAQSATQAVNDFMMMFTGLYDENVDLSYLLHDVRKRTVLRARPRQEDACITCGGGHKSNRARGDRARLPCRG